MFLDLKGQLAPRVLRVLPDFKGQKGRKVPKAFPDLKGQRGPKVPRGLPGPREFPEKKEIGGQAHAG